VGYGGSGYERELRSLLAADDDALRRYSNRLDVADRGVLRRLDAHPFVVVRAAGSFGFDLVALHRDYAFPIEVKASRSHTIRFSAASGRAEEQLAQHRRMVERHGLVILYAYRRLGERGNGDPWRLYTPKATGLRPRLDLVRKWLPPIDSTRNGGAVLRWDEGMPLVRFLDRFTQVVS
jgi:Holliday junction resolvase